MYFVNSNPKVAGKVLQSAPSGVVDAKGEVHKYPVVVGKSTPNGEHDGQPKMYVLSPGAELKEGEKYAEVADVLTFQPDAVIEGHVKSKKTEAPKS